MKQDFKGRLYQGRKYWHIQYEHGRIGLDRSETIPMEDGMECVFDIKRITPRDKSKNPFEVAINVEPVLDVSFCYEGEELKVKPQYLMPYKGNGLLDSYYLIDSKLLDALEPFRGKSESLDAKWDKLSKMAKTLEENRVLEAELKPTYDKVQRLHKEVGHWWENTTPKERCSYVWDFGYERVWDAVGKLREGGFDNWGRLRYIVLPTRKESEPVHIEMLRILDGMDDIALLDFLKKVYATFRFNNFSFGGHNKRHFFDGVQESLKENQKSDSELSIWGIQLTEGNVVEGDVKIVINRNNRLINRTMGEYKVYYNLPDYFPKWHRYEEKGIFLELWDGILKEQVIQENVLSYSVGNYYFTPACSFPKGADNSDLTIDHWKIAKLYAVCIRTEEDMLTTISDWELREMGYQKSFLQVQQDAVEYFEMILEAIFEAREEVPEKERERLYHFDPSTLNLTVRRDALELNIEPQKFNI